MSAIKDKPFFLTKNDGIGQVVPADDLLHPLQNKDVSDDTLAETQYFGFHVADQSIHGMGYLWHHPNLHVVSGGVIAFQGFKHQQVAAELCDFRAFMNDSALNNDLHDYRLPNGYGVKIVKPLQQFKMTYADDARKNSLDLDFNALQAPVMFADCKHFEQAMKVTGELVLRGKRYEVNCYNIRDRSWAKPRQESLEPLPPYSWINAVFNEAFALNCGILDQADGNPELKGRFEMPMDKTVTGGWIQRDGEVGYVVRGIKKVTRDAKTLFPISIELEITDSFDRTVEIRGHAIAACPFQVWANVLFPLCLFKWECDGMVAYGDLQEGIWNDYGQYVSPVQL